MLDCKRNRVISQFFRFEIANRQLKNSYVQEVLLEEEIKFKRLRINTLKKTFTCSMLTIETLEKGVKYVQS